MIAQSCRLCRQGVFLPPLIFQTSRGSSIRKTFVFHFSPLTSYRFCLPDVSFLDAKRQCGPAGWGVSCVTANCRADTEREEERWQGVQAVPPWFFPLPKVGLKPVGLPFVGSWAKSGWVASIYILNILWRCVQLTYLHLMKSFVLVYWEAALFHLHKPI